MRVADVMYDYQSRVKRARTIMWEQAFDGLYVTAGANMYYLTGFSAFERGWPIWLSTFILPLNGDPVFIMSEMHEEGFRGARSWVTDIRTYVDGQDPSGLLEDALREKGLTSAKIGVEDDMWFGDSQLLARVAPQAKVESAQEIFDRLRIIKDDREIEYISKATAITDIGFETALKAVKEGRLEYEVAREIATALLEAGSETMVVGGRFSTMRKRRIERGDIIDIDLAEVRYKEYTTDAGRIFFVGPPKGEHREIYKVILEAYEKTLETIKPGVEAQEVHRAGAGVIERAGYHQSWKIGHGVGLTIHEAPMVQEGDHTVLEPRMIFTIDPGVALQTSYYTTIRVEDVVVVRERGVEVLSQFDRRLKQV